MRDKITPVLQKMKKYLYIFIYNILKTMLPLDETKIVIASNRATTLEGNLLWISNALKAENYNIKILLTEKTDIKYNINLIITIANAKYTIIDDFFPLIYPLQIRKETKLIQVWHALGAFKKVGFSRIGKIGGPSEKSISHKNYTDVIVSSESVVDNYAEAFRVSNDKIHPIGIPRTDFFFDENKKKDAIENLYNEYPVLKDKRVILFAPTFRGNGKKGAHYPQEHFNIEKIYNNLAENEVLAIKYHPFIKERPKITKEQSKKIIDLTSYKDINDLLLITDLLITDYSSTIFEYAILEKPIIFYVPDIEEYQQTRDFYYDFDQYTYGPICKDMNELSYNIRSTTIDKNKLHEFKQKFLNMCDGNSTKRFVEYIIKENIILNLGEKEIAN